MYSRTVRRSPRQLALAAALCATGALHPAVAAPLLPTALFSSSVSPVPSTVPGTTLNFLSFNRATFSPDGTQWAFQARTTSGNNATDEIVVRGSGFTRAGSSVVLREGDSANTLATGATYGTIQDQIGINNSGQFAASVQLNGIGTTTDRLLVRGNGSALERIAREGSQVVGAPVGTNYGPTLDSPVLLNNGNVRFRNFTTASNQYLLEASSEGTGTVIAQSGNTVPGQLVAPPQTTNGYGGNTKLATDGSGTNTLYSGLLAGATTSDTVVVFNNAVVAQEGAALPGVAALTANVLTLDGLLALSGSGGNYSIRGSVNDGAAAASRSDFVLLNGSLLAKTGDAIFAGSGETWNDDQVGTTATFFTNSVNMLGQTLVGGYTSGGADSNEVLVFDNAVVLREGDRVDLDGDGLFTENAFIDRFFSDSTTLTDAGLLYSLVGLRNTAVSSGTGIGSALVVRGVTAAVVPESGALPLAGIGLSLLGVARVIVRRKR